MVLDIKGNREVVLTDHDFINLVDEYMGDEAYNYLQLLLDEYQNIIVELQDEIQELQDYIDGLEEKDT